MLAGNVFLRQLVCNLIKVKDVISDDLKADWANRHVDIHCITVLACFWQMQMSQTYSLVTMIQHLASKHQRAGCPTICYQCLYLNICVLCMRMTQRRARRSFMVRLIMFVDAIHCSTLSSLYSRKFIKPFNQLHTIIKKIVTSI